jgi:hypothetical protein
MIGAVSFYGSSGISLKTIDFSLFMGILGGILVAKLTVPLKPIVLKIIISVIQISAGLKPQEWLQGR